MTRHQPRDKVRVTRLASILRTNGLSSQVFLARILRRIR